MPQTFQLRRGTAAEWLFANPILQAGELGYETDTRSVKAGNGVDRWSDLEYVAITADIVAEDISSGTISDDRLSANVVLTTDSRLSDSRAPTSHASTHATGGSDAIAPADIGASPAASPTFSGTVTHSGLVRWEYPQKTLDAAVTDLGYLRVYDETGFAAGLGVSTVSFNIGTQGAINLRFVTNGTQRAIIDTAGDVGIGTNSPSSLLDVNGVITVAAGSGTAPAIVASGDSNTGIAFPAADTFSVSTAGTERLRVKSTGAIRFFPLAADPASGEAGDVYYNSTNNKLRVYNGTSWIDLH